MAKSAKKNSKKDLMQTAFTRFMLVVAFFVLWIGGISVRLVHLQVSQHGWLKEKALDQRQDEKKTKMLRGTIYDRDGHALAMSVRVKTLFADATEIEDIEAAARDISKALKINQTDILNALKEGKETNKRFIPLVKKLDEDTSQKLNKALAKEDVRKADLPLYPGLHWKEDQKRSYPYQSLAAHVIGFSDSDEVGQAGVEKSQDKSLHGAVVKKMQERDRLGLLPVCSRFSASPLSPVSDAWRACGAAGASLASRVSTAWTASVVWVVWASAGPWGVAESVPRSSELASPSTSSTLST